MHRLCTCALAIVLTCSAASAEEARTGVASFYAEVPDRSERLTAAHRSLPFGTMVNVTRTDTGAHVVVRINDDLATIREEFFGKKALLPLWSG